MLIGGAVGALAGAAIGSQIQKPEPPPAQVVVAQPAPVVVAQGRRQLIPETRSLLMFPIVTGDIRRSCLKDQETAM